MGLVIVVIPTVTTVMWGMVVQSRPVKLMEEMVGTTTLTRPVDAHVVMTETVWY